MKCSCPSDKPVVSIDGRCNADDDGNVVCNDPECYYNSDCDKYGYKEDIGTKYCNSTQYTKRGTCGVCLPKIKDREPC